LQVRLVKALHNLSDEVNANCPELPRRARCVDQRHVDARCRSRNNLCSKTANQVAKLLAELGDIVEHFIEDRILMASVALS